MVKLKRSRNTPRPARSTGNPMGNPLAGGGGKNTQLISQMQKLQEEMEKTQSELEQEEVTVTVGGGAITVVATGGQQIRAITIKPEVVDPDDVEMLQDLVLSAVNEALQQGKALAEERMGALTGGLGLPPGLGL
ncbi:MAG: YbaB/EbfC family nucleoid-associated protein [Caldilineaceae bacterium]